MATYTVTDESQLTAIALEAIREFNACDKWLLTGDLGAGKTTFTKYLIRALGSDDVVTSPTFSIVNTYTLPEESKYTEVLHIDLYRIEEIEEALNIGIEEMLDRSDQLKIIEWPAIIEPLLDEQPCIKVEIQHLEMDHRKFLILKDTY